MSKEEGSSANALWKRVSWSKSDEGEQEEKQHLLGNSSQTIYDNEIQIQIDEATSAANSTIGKLLNRGEDIKDIKVKAEGLQRVGAMFKKNSKKHQDNAWWTRVNEKIWTIILIMFLVALGILMVIGIIHLILGLIYPNGRPEAPVMNNPSPQPPSQPGTVQPAPNPGNPPNGALPVICNCICPPTYYPVPPAFPQPSQSPKIVI